MTTHLPRLVAMPARTLEDIRPIGSESRGSGRDSRGETTRDRVVDLLERAGDVLFRVRLRPFQVTYVSPAVEKLLGFATAEIYADPQLPLRCLFRADPAALGHLLRDHRLSGGATVPVIRRDGHRVEIQIHWIAIRDHTRARIAIEGIAHYSGRCRRPSPPYGRVSSVIH